MSVRSTVRGVEGSVYVRGMLAAELHPDEL
jgi:hypothetical protein